MHSYCINLTLGSAYPPQTSYFQSLTADLQKFINTDELPEILLSVCYNATLCRLTVNVVEGKNVKVSSIDIITNGMQFCFECCSSKLINFIDIFFNLGYKRCCAGHLHQNYFHATNKGTYSNV